MNTTDKDYWIKLKRGHIIGVIDSYDAVHSHFTGEEMKFHAEFWPIRQPVMWRWCDRESIWWITSECRPNDEQYDAIQRHITKKYGLPFWENGHHDLDFLSAKLRESQSVS